MGDKFQLGMGAGWIGFWVGLFLVRSVLGLSWEHGEGYRSAVLEVSRAGKVGFTRLPPESTGLSFTNHLADESAARNQILMNGSGVALGDVDGDGWCDVYLCRLEGPNALFRNLGGWKFEDITARAGVACSNQFSSGTALADVDGDQDLDLLVNSVGHGTRLFLNNGQAVFREATEAGLQKKDCGTSLALADVDGDGDLDLYVANYRSTTIRSTGLDILNIDGRRMLRPQDRDQYEVTPEGFLIEHGEVDVFYLNDGRGRFSEVPWNTGHFLDRQGKPLSEGPKDWSLTAVFRDINQDGFPDLYVCNDFWSPDRIWINDGAAHFRALSSLAVRHTSTFSMNVDFADINRDGHDDFLVLDMMSRDHQRRMRQVFTSESPTQAIGRLDDQPQTERNTLFLNRGDGTYAEIAQLSGLHASEWSWSAVFIDVDLDGFEDVLLGTGHDFDTQDADTDARIAKLGPSPPGRLWERLLLYPRLFLPNLAFRNRGDLTFEETGTRWGFDEVGVSQALALADLDQDGDQDVIVNSLNAAVGAYRNDSDAPRVAVRLRGRAPNHHAIGSALQFRGGPVSRQQQQILAGGRYLSCDDPTRVFAASGTNQPLTLQVTWPDRSRSELAGLQPNRVYEIWQDKMAVRPPASPSAPSTNASPLFQDLSDLLYHIHHEEPFNDFARQRLLPRRLSQAGPGVAWCDLDGDGREDLLIGCGRGGSPAFFLNKGETRFVRLDLSAPFARTTDDLTTLLGIVMAAGHTTLLVGQSNYETAGNNQPAVLLGEWWAGGIALRETLPPAQADVGPLTVADVDADGDLDLFVGGRALPGRYPEPAGSLLYLNNRGLFEPAQSWPGLGLVNGAVFSDLTGDGFVELILACEWGPVRVFRNERGRFTEATAALGLDKFQGWWNGVATGDFDGDGHLDIVASNWGRNTPYEPFVERELRVVYADFIGSGIVDALEGYWDPVLNKAVPRLQWDRVSAVLPWVRDQFPSWTAFSKAGLEEVLGDHAPKAGEHRVNWLSSTLFLNRGDRFEARPLPTEAQFAPAFGLAVADFDGDGEEDLFLSQNFFGVEESVSRYDAGTGSLLRGNGQGQFQSLPPVASGIRLHGEQRGAAACDYDQDGRVDLAVGQNGTTTALYQNRNAKPGLRVRLHGPVDNPQGLGAQIRIAYQAGLGPVRQVRAGGGYWSQDSAVQVLGLRERDQPEKLVVLWPGGQRTETSIPPQAREVTCAAP